MKDFHTYGANFAEGIFSNDKFRSAGPIHQCEHVGFLGSVIEGAELSDLLEAAHAIERVEKLRIAGGQFAGLQITAAQIYIAKSFRTLACEKVKT